LQLSINIKGNRLSGPSETKTNLPSGFKQHRVVKVRGEFINGDLKEVSQESAQNKVGGQLHLGGDEGSELEVIVIGLGILIESPACNKHWRSGLETPLIVIILK